MTPDLRTRTGRHCRPRSRAKGHHPGPAAVPAGHEHLRRLGQRPGSAAAPELARLHAGTARVQRGRRVPGGRGPHRGRRRAGQRPARHPGRPPVTGRPPQGDGRGRHAHARRSAACTSCSAVLQDPLGSVIPGHRRPGRGDPRHGRTADRQRQGRHRRVRRRSWATRTTAARPPWARASHRSGRRRRAPATTAATARRAPATATSWPATCTVRCCPRTRPSPTS